MVLRNIDKVEESIRKFQGNEYSHYFVIDRPDWDSQNIYNEIFYNVESELFHGGYIEIYSLITDEELEVCVEKLKKQFNLPFKRWERVLVDYSE